MTDTSSESNLSTLRKDNPAHRPPTWLAKGYAPEEAVRDFMETSIKANNKQMDDSKEEDEEPANMITIYKKNCQDKSYESENSEKY